ncbi:HCNGP-like protein-domain-containing protein [Flagelloscypha sp. PMI_526]|nr:HCNGP-like protein-domain-containing protein [Flagelloscypha sp. PMI_526]
MNRLSRYSDSDNEQPDNKNESLESRTSAPEDELQTIRRLIRPPPIPGLVDYGIPPPTDAPCEPAIAAKLEQFHALKNHPTQPRHFNDSLMSNQSFLNPHLLDKLVAFVDVDEGCSNFPPGMGLWDDGPNPEEDWYADAIAVAQKRRYEQESSSKKNRTQIDFTTARPPPAGNSRFNPYGSHGTALRGSSGGSRKSGKW